jgi:hypothetical protein
MTTHNPHSSILFENMSLPISDKDGEKEVYTHAYYALPLYVAQLCVCPPPLYATFANFTTHPSTLR